MNEVLAAMKFMPQGSQGAATSTRVLTDLSGKNFTLVIESTAESMDAYWKSLQEMFKEPENSGQPDLFNQYIESGYREFYTIEYES
jgi:hypothetical protein